ncbi:MAG: glycosyltransferase family 2 protein [Firmicutes bacterium]|nr:glycosyltransferase family 2 protein [Bacillota bacterium]
MNKELVVLIPCYDPDEEIMVEFLKNLQKKVKNIVLVNDGCASIYDSLWIKLEKKYSVVHHAKNLGKGRALKSGINYILQNFRDVKTIVTADCDGQHSVEDIIKCGNVSIKKENSLIIGVRNFKGKEVPKRSKFGNELTSNIMNLFLGLKISDTQTGLRAMSLNIAKSLLDVEGERYEYETNVFLGCQKLDIEIEEVKIKTIYINENKTSHFNPLKDSLRIYKMFSKVFSTCLISFLIECLLFIFLMDLYQNIRFELAVLLSLFISKMISNMFILMINKHIEIIKVIMELLISFVVLILVNWKINLVFVKIIVDVILLVVWLFWRNKFNLKR